MNTQDKSSFPVGMSILLITPLITYAALLSCGYPLWVTIVGMVVTPFILMALYHYVPKLIIVIKEKIRSKS